MRRVSFNACKRTPLPTPTTPDAREYETYYRIVSLGDIFVISLLHDRTEKNFILQTLLRLKKETMLYDFSNIKCQVYAISFNKTGR